MLNAWWNYRYTCIQANINHLKLWWLLFRSQNHPKCEWHSGWFWLDKKSQYNKYMNTISTFFLTKCCFCFSNLLFFELFMFSIEYFSVALQCHCGQTDLIINLLQQIGERQCHSTTECAKWTLLTPTFVPNKVTGV